MSNRPGVLEWSPIFIMHHCEESQTAFNHLIACVVICQMLRCMIIQPGPTSGIWKAHRQAFFLAAKR